jgi:hypothetical protein
MVLRRIVDSGKGECCLVVRNADGHPVDVISVDDLDAPAATDEVDDQP